MPKFVPLPNVGRSNQLVYVNAANILWFERAGHGRVGTIVRFSGADRQFVIDGSPSKFGRPSAKQTADNEVV